MKRIFLLAAILTPMAVAADDRSSARYERDYRTPSSGRRLLGSVQSDLQAIWSRSRVDRHEANHFRDALNDLRDFEERSARGRFDQGRLSSAIRNIDHLADARQLHPRDRNRLRDHLYALRHLREGPQDFRRGW